MLRKVCISSVNTISRRSFISINHPRVSGEFFLPKTQLYKDEQSRNRNRDENDRDNQRRDHKLIPFLAASSFLSWFSKKDEEDTPENELIRTIKLSILNIQREEYKKAEQLLHVALKMAQNLQSKDGITYIYDIMANLAMEVGEYAKAEKLFTNVMQRLFADGFVEDHIKILHISSKIAHIAQLQGHLDKAMQGFEWTIAKLEDSLRKVGEDKEILELWGITKNWYAQMLMEAKRFAEARNCFRQAYDAYTQIHGNLTEEGLTILNNLSVACSNLEDYTSAESYLKEAISLAAQLPELTEAGVFRANLGLLYLQQGLLKQAAEFCSFAWKYGKQHKHEETVIQANYCLEQIKAMKK
ncbi:tetratricopeptide repeat protein 19 homolog, mitochondrial [Toxorhynchites rutilus septentrionalis]|uniref:tetratricopeptide repeat protein 19 homolog, mitochondrial n=1 Tax=Toxorhynchites rutilus septentrionalis TaxID=329112 RepID=UPI00247AAF0B|nr:tetratricopeptide repeat protein 19 homolog, mitochondrial [Toxorhynchites rutilus septentrionalis]